MSTFLSTERILRTGSDPVFCRCGVQIFSVCPSFVISVFYLYLINATAPLFSSVQSWREEMAQPELSEEQKRKRRLVERRIFSLQQTFYPPVATSVSPEHLKAAARCFLVRALCPCPLFCPFRLSLKTVCFCTLRSFISLLLLFHSPLTTWRLWRRGALAASVDIRSAQKLLQEGISKSLI